MTFIFHTGILISIKTVSAFKQALACRPFRYIAAQHDIPGEWIILAINQGPKIASAHKGPILPKTVYWLIVSFIGLACRANTNQSLFCNATRQNTCGSPLWDQEVLVFGVGKSTSALWYWYHAIWRIHIYTYICKWSSLYKYSLPNDILYTYRHTYNLQPSVIFNKTFQHRIQMLQSVIYNT